MVLEQQKKPTQPILARWNKSIRKLGVGGGMGVCGRDNLGCKMLISFWDCKSICLGFFWLQIHLPWRHTTAFNLGKTRLGAVVLAEEVGWEQLFAPRGRHEAVTAVMYLSKQVKSPALRYRVIYRKALAFACLFHIWMVSLTSAPGTGGEQGWEVTPCPPLPPSCRDFLLLLPANLIKHKPCAFCKAFNLKRYPYIQSALFCHGWFF